MRKCRGERHSRNNSAFKLEKLGAGASSSCFSILGVAKEPAESIKHGKSVPILKPKKKQIAEQFESGVQQKSKSKWH